ncbi:MAG: hypothetical protein R2873_25620 [Caldilineaceae bacterium]
MASTSSTAASGEHELALATLRGRRQPRHARRRTHVLDVSPSGATSTCCRLAGTIWRDRTASSARRPQGIRSGPG